MGIDTTRFRPPHCPNPKCGHHADTTGWHYKKAGFFLRSFPPRRVQRFRCFTCGVSFSFQTFQTTYWLKRPDVLPEIFRGSLSCSAHRQIGRALKVRHSTVMGQTERLGRHCLLFQQQFRNKVRLDEPLVADGFESFEFSQYHPCHFHLVVGANSHFLHAFTDSELRRKGRMTASQRNRRRHFEEKFGRPSPKSIEIEMAEALNLLPGGKPIELRTDEHPAYPRALRRVQREVRHLVTPSREARTAGNPLFPANLVDLLIRHSGSNHKRETIAYSKRRQAAAERLAIFQVWRNFIKKLSENRGHGTPAQRAGVVRHQMDVEDVLRRRLFLHRVGLPERLLSYYRREIETRRIPRGRKHRLKYAE